MNDPQHSVRIGGACGFWGDSAVAVPQLLRGGDVRYLTFDYLSEVTMSILARAYGKDPRMGYATDFAEAVLPELPEIVRRGTRLVTNAGGINPHGCAAAFRAAAAEAGLSARIAVVDGDDLTARVPLYREAGLREMTTGRPLPERVLSANAYLGAWPIARALERGADVVITGRCVDSALVLGILIAEFGWGPEDLDRLAAGTLAGHLIECGAQATGGLHTDWERVPEWATIGYPIVEVSPDGTFVLTKPPGTGGLVTPAVVAEQLLYEIGDPAAYVMPDVVCDFTNVRLRAESPEAVRVTGARGRAAPESYKVSATSVEGLRSVATLGIVGTDAARKAERTAAAILARTRALFAARGLAGYRATHVETIGAESIYGPHARAAATREILLRLVVDHDDPAAHRIFAREIAPAGTSYAPGTTGGDGGRPRTAPIVALSSFLIPKDEIAIGVDLEGAREELVVPPRTETALPVVEPVVEPVVAAGPARGVAARTEATAEVPLMALAYARSGDKGDVANVGVIARDRTDLPLLRAELTEERVAAYFAHLASGPVRRYELPGIGAFNFVIAGALGGGGMASMRYDPLGKAYAQMLLDLPIAVPLARLARFRHPEESHA